MKIEYKALRCPGVIDTLDFDSEIINLPDGIVSALPIIEGWIEAETVGGGPFVVSIHQLNDLDDTGIRSVYLNENDLATFQEVLEKARGAK